MRVMPELVFLLRVALLLAFGFGMLALSAWTSHEPFDRDFLLAALERAYIVLPMLVGVAIGTFGGEIRRNRVAIGVLFVMLAMAATDLAPKSGRRSVEAMVVADPGSDVWYIRDVSDDWSAPGALGLVFHHIKGAFEGRDDPTPVIRTDQPRWQLYRAYSKAFYLLSPIIAAGFVLGALSWTRRNLLFRSRSAELVVDFLLGWTLGPAMGFLAMTMGEGFRRGILFAGTPYIVVFMPYLTLLAISILGWASAEIEP